MIQLLQSSGLWALVAIAVPIIIHLWNFKQGKTLPVGSILLFSESARSHARSLRLTQWLLLLLRCLMIAALAVFISKPVYTSPAAAGQKGQILVDRSYLRSTYHQFAPLIDSLLTAGYSLHYFEAGFPAFSLGDTLQNSPASAASPANYWQLLRQANAHIPADRPVYLFTPNKMAHFSGERPEVHLNLRWQLFATADTLNSWIYHAQKQSPDSIRLTLAHSRPGGNQFSGITISTHTTQQQLAVADSLNGQFVIPLDTARLGNKAVRLDTSTRVITLFTDHYASDARYIRAVVTTISEFTGIPLRLINASSIAQIPANTWWLFWLSEQPVPSSLRAQQIFSYQKGSVVADGSFLYPDAAHLPANPVALYKRIQYPTEPQKDAVLWHDGFGNPVLTFSGEKNNHYKFYSRFQPQWSDLPWSNQFPQWMLHLLFQSPDGIAAGDIRQVDATQIQPVIAKGNSVYKQDLMEQTPLDKWCWLLAFCLFVIERLVSMRSKNVVNA